MIALRTSYYCRLATTLLFVVGLCALLAAECRADDAADQQYAVASAHYSQGRWQLAVTEFDRFLKDFSSDPKAARAMFYDAEAQIQLGQYAAASKLMQQHLARDPQGQLSRRALFRAGESAYLADTPDAASLLERFSTANPDDKLNAYALCYRGDLALAAGNPLVAEKFYAAQLDKFPTGGMRGQSQFGLARALAEQGKTDDAIKTLTALADSKDPLAADARAYLAALHYGGGNYKESLTACEAFAAPADHPRTAQVELLRCQSLYQVGKFADAQARLTKLIDTQEKQTAGKPSPGVRNLIVESQLWLGLSLKAQQQYAEAAKLLQTTAERNADHPLAATLRFHAGEALVRAGDFAAAEKLLRTDLTAKDNADTRRYLLAVCLQGQKRHAEALAQLESLKDSKDATDSLQADVLMARTYSLVALDRGSEAIEPLTAFVTSRGAAAKSDADRQQLVAPSAQLALLLARSKDFDRARLAFKAFNDLKPNDEARAATTQQLADAAYQAGDFNWSRELFAALGQKPPAGAAPANTASVASDGQQSVAAQQPNTPAEVSPKNNTATADALSGLAWSQYRANDFAAAADSFGKLADQNPADPRAAEFLWLRGQSLQRAGKLDEALAAYLAILAKQTDPKTADAKLTPQVLLAAARLHEQFHQTKEALALYERLAKDFATSPELEAGLLNWAWALSDAGQFEAAQKLFERQRHDFPHGQYWADATSRLAELHLANKDYDAANKLADEMLAAKLSDEATQRTLYLKGQIAAAGEHWDQVSPPLSKLIVAYPNSPLGLPAEYWLAEAAYRQKKFEDAGLQFESLAKKTAGRNDAWLAMIPLRRAQVLAQSHKWADARAMAEKIHEQFPDFVQQYEADYLIGRCFAADADFDKARQAYQLVLRSATGGKTETAAMAQWMIGESYFHQRQYDAAIREYLRLEILYAYPHWQAGALLQAGKCHEALGQWKSASELYARLLKNYPNTEFTEEAGKHLQTAQQKAVEVRK